MKLLLVAMLLCVASLSFPASSQNFTECRSRTVILPDGRILSCRECCYQGNCTTTCM